MDKVLFSHNSDDWATPKKLYQRFINKGFIDPCPLNCETNNLNIDYGDSNLFINQPYSDIKSWIDFSINHINKHKNNTIVLLIPSRTDTKYFHKLISGSYGITLTFIKGRLHFNDSKYSAPFPSILITISYKIKGHTFKGV